jgi:hypothetical protein
LRHCFIGEGHALAGFPNSQVSANGSTPTQGDGSHDFDFLIGDWKAHVRRLPERLKGSNVWVEYHGISNHKKLLDSNANFEEFDVSSPDHKLRIKAQTLRLYNPESHQWSIYLLDLDKGTLELPPLVGQFSGKRGEFYNQQTWEGRAVLVRYVWLNISPQSSRMEQSFSGSERETVTPPYGMRVLILGDSGYTRQHGRDGLEQSTGLAGVSGLPTRNQ